MHMSKPNIAVHSTSDEIIIEFDRPVTWIGLNPESTVKFMQALQDQIVKLTKKNPSPIIIPKTH